VDILIIFYAFSVKELTVTRLLQLSTHLDLLYRKTW